MSQGLSEVRVSILILVMFSAHFLVFAEGSRAQSGAVYLPKPVRIVYPEGSNPLQRHPFQYKTEVYKGKLTIQIGSGKMFDLGNRDGIRIEGLDTKKSHIVRYKLNDKPTHEF